MKYYKQISIELDIADRLNMIKTENKLPNMSEVIKVLMGGKKKMANKYPFPPDFKTIYEKADLLKARTESLTKKLRAFYFYTYLSGTRISEALDLQYNNIQFNTINGINICFATVFTRKNRVKVIRIVPISYTSEYEKKMFAEFAEVYNHSIQYVFNDLIVKNERDRQGYDKNLREIKYLKKDGTETSREFKDPYASTKTRLERYFSKIIFETPVLDIQKKTMNVEKYRLHPHLLRHFRAPTIISTVTRFLNAPSISIIIIRRFYTFVQCLGIAFRQLVRIHCRIDLQRSVVRPAEYLNHVLPLDFVYPIKMRSPEMPQ